MSWFVSRRSAGRQGLVICEQSGRNVAVAYDGADAPVLAAAPELLAVLKNLVDRKLIKDTHDDLYDEVNDHYEEVLEAIAKAEGRT